MFVFDENEFEIVIATYNRADFVDKLLDVYYDDCNKRNINITVLDSSTNNDTKQVVDDKNKMGWCVKYKRVSFDIIIGYKSVIALLESTCKYVWIMGDSRYQDLNEMDLKVFPLIKENVNFITFFPDKNKRDVYVYDNANEFLLEHLDSTTCIGTSIFNAELFRRDMTKPAFVADMDGKFAKNYGFAWLGYTFCSLAKNGGKTVYVNVGYTDIYSDKKKQTWAKRFYGCWCDDLCDLIEKLPDSFQDKNKVISNLWRQLTLDSWVYCFKARLSGDLNVDRLNMMKSCGRLQKCTSRIKRLYFVAAMPKMIIKPILYCRLLMGKVYHFIK